MTKVRKLVALAAVGLFGLATSFAYEMDIPKRYFEIGFDTDIGLSNNYFAAKEFLVKDLVIDFTEISNNIGKEGLLVNMLGRGEFVSGLYLDNGMTFTLNCGVDASGFGGLSKDLFDFLGQGNKLGEVISVDGDGTADAFSYVDTSYQFDWGDFGVRFGAGLFVPLFHAEFKDLKAVFENKDSGEIDMRVGGVLNAYGCGSLENVFEDVDIASFMEGINKGWGFDVSGSVERAILVSLQGRVYMRLPVVPGYMDNKMSSSVSAGFHADDFIDLYENGGKYDDFELSDRKYSKERFYLSRPFRTGYEIKWRPFGKYVSFNHQLGFGVKYPWTSDAKAYAEYNFGVDASVFNILGISLSSSYQREVFIQQVGIMLNARVIEIDVGASLQGASFAKSWAGSGAGVQFGFRMGF